MRNVQLLDSEIEPMAPRRIVETILFREMAKQFLDEKGIPVCLFDELGDHCRRGRLLAHDFEHCSDLERRDGAELHFQNKATAHHEG